MVIFRPINNVVNSLFSRVLISLNSTVIEALDDYMPIYRSYIQKTLSYQRDTKNTNYWLAGYYQDTFPLQGNTLTIANNEGFKRRQFLFQKTNSETPDNGQGNVGYPPMRRSVLVDHEGQVVLGVGEDDDHDDNDDDTSGYTAGVRRRTKKCTCLCEVHGDNPSEKTVLNDDQDHDVECSSDSHAYNTRKNKGGGKNRTEKTQEKEIDIEEEEEGHLRLLMRRVLGMSKRGSDDLPPLPPAYTELFPKEKLSKDKKINKSFKETKMVDPESGQLYLWCEKHVTFKGQLDFDLMSARAPLPSKMQLSISIFFTYFTMQLLHSEYSRPDKSERYIFAIFSG